MTAPAQLQPVLAFGSQSAVDLCQNALFVTRFLADVAPFVTDAGNNGPGLSEDGAQGLTLILSTVESTLSAAIDRM
jgi:hypothetical protein